MTDPIRPQLPLPTADEAIAQLVKAEGNTYLAAERLGIAPHELSAIIAQDQTAPDHLNAQLRTLTTLRTFETFQLVHTALLGALSTAEPKDLFSLVSKLTDVIERLTERHSTPAANINVTEYILKMLPEDVRESVLALLPSADAAAPTALNASTAALPAPTPISSRSGAHQSNAQDSVA